MPSALLFCSMEGSARASSLAASLHVKLGLSTPMVSAFLYSIAVFALLAHAYTTGDATVEVDIWLANVLHANATPSTTAVLAAVTTLGSTPVLLLVAGTAAGYLAGRRRGGEAALLVVTLVSVQLLGWMLKAIFERPRPSFDDPVASAGWFSFPSGHAMSSIALYGALAYAFADRLYSARTRMAAVGGLVLLVAAIGFSRLYLGVHYLTDVLAGYSAGLAWLLLAIGLQTRWQRVQNESFGTAPEPVDSARSAPASSPSPSAGGVVEVTGDSDALLCGGEAALVVYGPAAAVTVVQPPVSYNRHRATTHRFEKETK